MDISLIQTLKKRLFIQRGAWMLMDWIHRGPLPTVNSNSVVDSHINRPDNGPLTYLFHPAELVESLNPVLTADDITDFGAVEYVADPFMYHDEKWHLFFEVYNSRRTPDAAIGHATSSSLYEWQYQGIVLNTGYHLSFPYVFEYDGDVYMIPEQEHPSGPTVSTFQAKPFPKTWVHHCDLLSPTHQARDSVVFEFNNRWWLLTADTPNNEMYLYYAPTPLSTDWTPHPKNPVGQHGSRAARPAGRPFVTDDSVILFYQDCVGRYGRAVRAFEVQRLTTDTFAEREIPESPILSPDPDLIGWNSGCMHHYDAHWTDDRFVCAVDGNTDFGYQVSDGHWAIGIYEAPSGGKSNE